MLLFNLHHCFPKRYCLSGPGGRKSNKITSCIKTTESYYFLKYYTPQKLHSEQR